MEHRTEYAFDASDISSRTGGIMTKAQAVADARTDKTVYQSLDLSELNVRTDGNTALVTGINHVVGRDAQVPLLRPDWSRRHPAGDPVQATARTACAKECRMKQASLFAAAALVILASAFALVHAAINRSRCI